MQTLTMQGIAELAGVQRPVVSMWRSRYVEETAPNRPPFPLPAIEEPLRFAVDEVVAWLRTTELGNNPDAALETSLHTGALARIAAAPDRSSALLLLHQATGGAVSGLPAHLAEEAVSAQSLSAVLDASSLSEALADRELCRSVDELTEAAFSPTRVLDRLVDAFSTVDGAWSTEALTLGGSRGLARAAAEVLVAEPRTLVPIGAAGWRLACEASREISEADRARLRFAFGEHQELSDLTPEEVAAARALVASGCTAIPLPTRTTKDPIATRHLYLAQHCSADPDALASAVRHVLDELAVGDLAIVVGAAELMTDPPGRRLRAQLLAPTKQYVAPLRYVARLPKGVCRFAGRRRLAMWVFAPTGGHDVTVSAALGDAKLDPALGSTIGADILAATSTDDVRGAHVFMSGTQRRTQQLLQEAQLVGAVPAGAPSVSGGERLAAVWAHEAAATAERHSPGLLEDLTLEASDAPRAATIPLGAMPRELARNLAGVRLAAELVGRPAAGAATVIGTAEVRDPSLIGQRAIDRLDLERTAPRARLTEPGDVIYVSAGGAAAWLDEDGGHVVEAPARILRCAAPGARPDALIPAMVAADINAQSGTDAKSWRLRHVPAPAAPLVATFTARAATHRRELLDHLAALDALERELTTGIADGTLRAITTASKGHDIS